MKAEYQNRIVQIYWKALDGSEERVATGFAVSASRILTCAHIAKDDGELKVRFIVLNRDKWFLAKVLWPPNRDFEVDVCVLGIDQEKDKYFPSIHGFSAFGFINPKDHDPWVSRGLPRAANTTSIAGTTMAHVVDLGGKLFEPTDGHGMTLEVSTYPANPQNWAGASGSPVFVKDRLVGVVSSWPSAWGGGRINAVCIVSLLRGPVGKDPEYREAMALPKGPDPIEKLLAEVMRELSKPNRDRFRRMLAEVLELESSDATRLSQELAGQTFEQTLILANRLHAQVFGEHAHEVNLELAGWIEDLFDLLLPITNRYFNWVAEIANPGVATILELPCATMTMAEIHLAIADARKAEFQELSISKEDPYSVFRIDLWPCAGFDEKETSHLELILEHLMKSLPVARSLVKSRKLEDKAEVIEQVLALRANPDKAIDGPKHYHFLFESEEQRKLAENLQKLLPHLLVCHLQKDQGPADEATLCDLLRKSLQRKHNRKKPS